MMVLPSLLPNKQKKKKKLKRLSPMKRVAPGKTNKTLLCLKKNKKNAYLCL